MYRLNFSGCLECHCLLPITIAHCHCHTWLNQLPNQLPTNLLSTKRKKNSLPMDRKLHVHIHIPTQYTYQYGKPSRNRRPPQGTDEEWRVMCNCADMPDMPDQTCPTGPARHASQPDQASCGERLYFYFYFSWRQREDKTLVPWTVRFSRVCR